jgi:hypothetical protein
MPKRKQGVIRESTLNGTADVIAPPNGLFVAVCSLGQVRVEWAISFALQQSPFGIPRHTLFIPNRSTIEARNLAVRLAYQSHAKYLMFWDDDMIPKERDGLERMYTTIAHNPQVDVIGAVYPIRRPVPAPIVVEDRASPEVYWGWEDGKAHKVYMVGTGFMMIRLQSFETIPLPWFDDAATMSDDYHFAELCRKQEKSIYVDGAVVCDQINLDGTRYSVYDARGSALADEKTLRPNSGIVNGWNPSITKDGLRVIEGEG